MNKTIFVLEKFTVNRESNKWNDKGTCKDREGQEKPSGKGDLWANFSKT